MAFKEIHVSSETIRQIYARFLSDLEPLVPLAEAKVEAQAQSDKEHRQQELELYRDYVRKGGKNTDLNPVWYLNFGLISDPVSGAIASTRRILDAAKFTDTFTLTSTQARVMHEIQSGEELEGIKKWLDNPIHVRDSYIRDYL